GPRSPPALHPISGSARPQRMATLSPASSAREGAGQFPGQASEETAMDRLKGKVAVITGAAVGLGRATAIRMAEEGAAVAILDVQDAPGEALATELAGRGLKAR